MSLLNQFRKAAFVALAIASALLTNVSANATVLNFNSQPEGYWVSSIVEQGYTVSTISDGLGANNADLWPSNGTTHLMSWTNGSSTSGFTLSANDSSVFAVTSFAFASGYVLGYTPVTSLTVSGTGGDVAFSQTFTSNVDFFDFGPSLTELSLAGGHTATQYTFTAIGANNRAIFDDINIGATVNAVPEPGSLALIGLGIAGLAAVRRRKSA